MEPGCCTTQFSQYSDEARSSLNRRTISSKGLNASYKRSANGKQHRGLGERHGMVIEIERNVKLLRKV